MPRGGLFRPTLRGTIGLMGSSCRSASGETEDVSDSIGSLLTVTAAEDGVLRPELFFSGLGTRWLRAGIDRGCFEGLSARGCTSVVRPLAPLHGSRGFVSTLNGFELSRAARSVGMFFFCPPLIET